MPTAEYPIHDEALAANQPLSVDVAQDLVLDLSHVYQDRLMPIIARVPYVTGGHSEWYKTHDPSPSAWDNTNKVYSWSHLLSSAARAARWHWFIKNNGTADAAMRLRYTLGSLPIHGSIVLPTPNGEEFDDAGVSLVDWGGAAFHEDAMTLSLDKVRGQNPDGHIWVTFTVWLKKDCEIRSLCGWEI